MAETFDVVVVGFGLAGAIAAIEAHDQGGKVIILEKQAAPGGISICAGGGVRIAYDVDQATEYLKASSAETTAEPVLRALARGMVELPRYIESLAEPIGAAVSVAPGKGNYPLPGYETWGFIEVDSVPGLNPDAAYPHVRAEGAAKGITMFALAQRHVMRRGIEVRLGAPVDRLWRDVGEIRGVRCGEAIVAARRAVVLACGGFEAAEDLQRQFWPAPMRSAATLANTGDGIRMAQAAGAGLWHMWHCHGVYGFHHPDPAYKLGIRIRRLRNWTPGSRSKDNLPALPGVIFRIMANAFEYVLVAACRLHPCGDRTTRVDADDRIGDDAAGSARARLFIQLSRIQPYDKHLVQARALADNRCLGVFRPSIHRRAIELQVIGFDDLVSAGSIAEARSRGKARIEGKDYVMADGDVVEFRFNV